MHDDALKRETRPGAGVDTPAKPIVIRALVLEDQPADAELMVRELRRAGFDPDWKRVDTESEYLAALHPALDVILADYRLPGFDAPSALHHLQEAGFDIPFIIVSGVISEEVAVSCMKQGAADYLLKDRMARLGQAVARALDLHRRRAEKERAERDLRDSEERFRLLVDGGKDYAMMILDPDGHVASWNPGAERIFGFRAEQIIGQHFSRFHGPEDITRGKPEAELEIAATEGRFEEQGWRHGRDGRPFWADVVITALHEPDGSLRGFSIVTRDITERRRAQEALSRQAQELERSNAELEIFAHVASHDLKEPLSAAAEHARALLDRVRGHVDPDVDQRLVAVVDTLGRMQRLVDDLLHFSRAHQQGAVFVAADCAQLCDTAIANLKPAIAEAGATVTRGPLPIVTGDPGQLTQLFQNLISNAIGHRAAAPPVVKVSAVKKAGVWEFVVQDNGSGIPESEGEAVFALFHRGSAEHDTPGGGIGLAICRKVVEGHGGRIRHEPAPGGGTIFRFTIPAGPHDA